MRAPVYRNIEARNTFLGLAFPIEAALFLGGCVLFIQCLAPGLALVANVGLYVGIRLLGYGRPPLFLQHVLQWRFRQLLCGGRLSAAARSRCPRFPHAPYDSRDVPPRGSR